MDAKFTELVEQLNGLDFKGMYGSDFLHTWDCLLYTSFAGQMALVPACWTCSGAV